MRPELITDDRQSRRGAVRGRLRMFVFGSRVSTRTVTGDLCGCTGRAAMSPGPRFEVRELGEIDMVSVALATLDLVAAMGTGLLGPPGTGTGSWLDEPPRQPGAWPAHCASCPADQR
jgi:hypothetical protein